MAACFVPMNQRFIILNLDFTLLRLLIVIAVLKLTIKGDSRIIQWNMFDKLILNWVLVGTIVYIVQQQANFSAIILKSGVMLDSLGIYWLSRQVIYDWDDFFLTVKMFAVFAIITAPFIALEKFQGSSFFSLFGPVTGSFHRGRFRAAGPFPHYIMMGCFWASLLPFFYARIQADKDTLFYWIAIIAVLSNVYFSASSTSIMTVGAIIIFWKLYNYRMHGKKIFWTICCCLFLLHFIMKAPVWHLLSRMDIFAGSTGWHRYFLFDNFIKHISEWFVVGTKSTAHWGHAQNDITNQFVLEGVRGGIVTLLLFVLVIYYSIKIPGKFSLGTVKPEVRWISWGLCVAMLGHFVTFWGVSYFGQINMLLYFMFALVGFVLERYNQCSEEQIIGILK
jgi:hypothetical protein